MAKRQLQSAIGTHAVKHSFLEIERKRDEMELHAIHLPSVADYVAAFQATEARITPKQRELLLVHHRAQARVTSATRLAEAVGFENYNAVNLQYGLLARQIADQLGIELNESGQRLLVAVRSAMRRSARYARSRSSACRGPLRAGSRA